MAKSKKTARPSSTSELAADAQNPRRISDTAKAGLRSSLAQFGDLSGIVWNSRTRQLVAGHQRVNEIKSKYGEREIVAVDESKGLFGIMIDAEHFFPVRVVDWSLAKQRAANVTANNAKIAGEFSDSLEQYLLDVKADIQSEMGADALDVLMLSALLPDDAGTGSAEVQLTSVYQIVVECTDEAHQKTVHEKLTKQGLQCRVITI